MAAHEDRLVYPEIPWTWTPRRSARLVTSWGFWEDTKKPSAVEPTWDGNVHPAHDERASATSAAPIAHLRMPRLPDGPAPSRSGRAPPRLLCHGPLSPSSRGDCSPSGLTGLGSQPR